MQLTEGKPVRALSLDGEPFEIGASDVAALRARLRGPVILEAEEGYEDSRKVWNGMIDRRPAIVVRPTGTADVVDCVNFARSRNLLLSIRGAGHNIAGTAVADGGILLDMSRMKGVFVDATGLKVQVQPGCALGDVDRETQLHGLATALGFVSETGIAGLTLGGGFGYLTRRFGWTVDNLLEVEIVTADGKVLRANQAENDDLFWAVRGGGGNFGVVTSFTFRLHPLGPKIMGGVIAWPADRAQQILELYRAATATAPRALTLVLTIRFAPPAPFVPAEWHGKPVIAIIACHSGTKEQAEGDLATLRKFGHPIFDTVMEKNYTLQQSMLDTTQPRGNNYYWKSEYLSKLTDGVLQAIREQGALETSALSQMMLFHIEGSIGDRRADDGAVGNRDARYVMVVVGGWRPNEGDGRSHISWVRVKAKYDAQNFFRVNRNVSPKS